MYYFDEEKHMDHQCTFIWEEYVPGGCHWRYRGRESLLDSSGAINPPTLLSRSFVCLTAFFGSADGRSALGRPGRHRSREWRSGW